MLNHFYKFSGQQCQHISLTTLNHNITEKENFPLKEIFAGDTVGNPKELYGQLGPLICEGGNVNIRDLWVITWLVPVFP